MKINLENLGFYICQKAKYYYNTKENFKQAWKECHRVDWMLYFAKQIGVDIRTLTLASALCAKTVMHLMKDERSINAVLIAEKYGRGEATDEELNEARKHALKAYLEASRAAHFNNYCANYDAVAAAAARAAYAAAAANSAYAAYAVADASKNQQATADICRDILTKEVFEKLEINK